METTEQSTAQRLRELAMLFTRLGATAFGGPAAHIAMLRDEVVTRRAWMTDQEFLDTLGATNLVPGPNSTEMAIHIGALRAGWRGLLVAGICFIAPAMLIVLALAAVYVQYGTTPTATWLLYGIKPVVLAIVLQALWGLSRTAIKGWFGALLGVTVVILMLLGMNELLLLLLAAAAMVLVRRVGSLRAIASSFVLFGAAPAAAGAVVAGVSLTGLFLVFLKIGTFLYGSGYVLLAFMRSDLVERLGWLTDQQLLDAVAIGQVTPGPLFTTATFVGYLLAGLPGALVATIGIFLPAFIFVAISRPIIPRLRASPVFAAALDGVNIASLGLMIAVSIQLAYAAVVDWLTVLLVVSALVVLIRWKLNSIWLVLIGGAIGLAMQFVMG